MIHRGLLSSMERMVAHLLEQTEGVLPPWLSPVQVHVLPVAAAHEPAALALAHDLRDVGIRAQMHAADSSLGARVRAAQERRVPYVAVLGDREVADGTVALRLRAGRQVAGVSWGRLVEEVAAVVAERRVGLGFD